MIFASNKIESFILGILDDLEAIALVNMTRMMERVLALYIMGKEGETLNPNIWV